VQGQDESSRSKKLVLTEVWKRELNTRNKSPDYPWLQPCHIRPSFREGQLALELSSIGLALSNYTLSSHISKNRASPLCQPITSYYESKHLYYTWRLPTPPYNSRPSHAQVCNGRTTYMLADLNCTHFQ